MDTVLVSATASVDVDKNNIRVDNASAQMACDPVTFGWGTDHSGTQPTQTIADDYAWLAALINSPASRRFAAAPIVQVSDPDTGKCENKRLVGQQANLVPVNIEGTPCCVKLPEMEGRGFYAGISQVCVEDCLTDDEIYWLQETSGAQLSNNANVLALKGTDLYQRRIDLLKKVFWFQFAREVAFAKKDTYGDGLTPAVGIQDHMSRASTMHFDGTNLIGAIKMAQCFMDMSTNGKWMVLGNKFGISTLNKTLNELFAQTGEHYFSGVRVAESPIFDMSDTFTSSLWFINLEHTGIIVTNGSLNPNTLSVETTQTVQDDASLGACKAICNRVRDRFEVAKDDFNAIFAIDNIATPSACLGLIGRFANQVGVKTLLDR